MEQSPQSEMIVTLVHGTFAQNAKWVRCGSPLRAGMKKAFGNRISFRRFCWSGDNTVWARLEASRELTAHLERVAAERPGARQILVAHSHGGNVALYALREVSDAQIAGVACIATPFLHAGLRDQSLLDSQTLRNAFFAVWSLGLVIVYLFWFNLFEPLAALAGLAALVVGAFVSAWLGGYLAGGLGSLRDTASAMAKELSCLAPPTANLYIVRKVGDEASLALGLSQFFSWAAGRAFARLSEKDELGSRRPFALLTGRPLPKPIWLFWWITIGATIALIGWRAFTHPFDAEPPTLALPLRIAYGAALSATFLIKTTLFERPLFGFVFLVQVGATFLEVFAFGSIPPATFQGEAVPFRRSLRWLSGLLLAMLIEINAEVTPLGRWFVRQFDQTDDERRANSTALAHSPYDDPRVIRDLIRWIAASTGYVCLPCQPVSDQPTRDQQSGGGQRNSFSAENTAQ